MLSLKTQDETEATAKRFIFIAVPTQPRKQTSQTSAPKSPSNRPALEYFQRAFHHQKSQPPWALWFPSKSGFLGRLAHSSSLSWLFTRPNSPFNINCQFPTSAALFPARGNALNARGDPHSPGATRRTQAAAQTPGACEEADAPRGPRCCVGNAG